MAYPSSYFTPNAPLPQGFCTCCFLCPECSSACCNCLAPSSFFQVWDLAYLRQHPSSSSLSHYFIFLLAFFFSNLWWYICLFIVSLPLPHQLHEARIFVCFVHCCVPSTLNQGLAHQRHPINTAWLNVPDEQFKQYKTKSELSFFFLVSSWKLTTGNRLLAILPETFFLYIQEYLYDNEHCICTHTRILCTMPCAFLLISDIFKLKNLP